MKWLRNLFARSQANGAVRPRRTFRPQLDVLEDRRLCSVSAVFTKTGGLQTFIVDKNGLLTRNGAVLSIRPGVPAGVTVRNAHGFLDKKGKVSVDVVYSDGQAWRSDSAGAAFVADHVLNMNTAVTSTGVVKTFFVFADPAAVTFGPNLKGTFVQRVNGVDTTLDTNVRWVSAFIDANGKIGLVKGKIDAANNLVVTRTVGGTTTLYNSPNGATQDITHYSQTSFNGQTVIDITWGRFAGTYALRFRQNKVIMIGDGSSIAVGG